MSRKEFTAKTKLEAWRREDGHCQACTRKIRPGDGPEYDHEIEDFYNGGNNIENCRVLCTGCHSSKTGTRAGTIAKSRRLIKRQAGIKKPGNFRRPDGYKYNWSAGRYERI